MNDAREVAKRLGPYYSAEDIADLVAWLNRPEHREIIEEAREKARAQQRRIMADIGCNRHMHTDWIRGER